jgi:hypothetical protein
MVNNPWLIPLIQLLLVSMDRRHFQILRSHAQYEVHLAHLTKHDKSLGCHSGVLLVPLVLQALSKENCGQGITVFYLIMPPLCMKGPS